MKNVITTFVLLLYSIVNAQQNPLFTQYNENINLINPAYSGSFGGLNITYLQRLQWEGFPGAPKTQVISIHSPINSKVGLGTTIYRDIIGPLTQTDISADFAYSLNLKEYGSFAFGIRAGTHIKSLNLNLLRTEKTELASDEYKNSTDFNIGIGVFYFRQNFNIGFTVSNLINTISENKKQYFLNTGYVFDIQSGLKLRPSFLITMSKGTPVNLNLSINALLLKFLDLGISYRVDDSISLISNIKLTKDLNIGLSYDYTSSELSTYNDGTFEIFVNYIIRLPYIRPECFSKFGLKKFK
ncbi:MAG: type IX secretion system membrane protein PorP/SprF [Flavobacteriaceae bacterium]|nr:type IX secretion system membrane protein PorP/SprF [Flavobacteriaceae bacterium]